MTSKFDWIIGLDGTDYAGWRIGAQPEGGGLVLMVDRGIPCEFHVDMVSCHFTNCPSKEQIQKVIETYKEEIEGAIKAFVTFAYALKKAHAFKDENCEEYMLMEDYDFSGTIGLLFEKRLLQEIGTRALMIERLDEFDPKALTGKNLF